MADLDSLARYGVPNGKISGAGGFGITIPVVPPPANLPCVSGTKTGVENLYARHTKIWIEPQSTQRAQSIKNQAATLRDLCDLCG